MSTKVLVVDDDELARRGLARSLRARLGEVEVLEAADGDDACSLLEQQSVDVVISDLRMPRMDGFELLSWMQRERPRTRVLLMTAYTADLDERELDVLSRVELLSKPIDVRVVESTLRRIVRGDPIGHIADVSLPSFLQLLQMERKTCLLEVELAGGKGLLAIHQGEVVDAYLAELEGDEAALLMCSAETRSIQISKVEGSTKTWPRKVTLPLNYLLMESARLRDEVSESSGLLRAEPLLEALGQHISRPAEPPLDAGVPQHISPRDSDVAFVRSAEAPRDLLGGAGVASGGTTSHSLPDLGSAKAPPPSSYFDLSFDSHMPDPSHRGEAVAAEELQTRPQAPSSDPGVHDGPGATPRFAQDAPVTAGPAPSQPDPAAREIFEEVVVHLAGSDVALAAFWSDPNHGRIVELRGCRADDLRGYCQALAGLPRPEDYPPGRRVQDLVMRTGPYLVMLAWLGATDAPQCIGVVGRAGQHSEALLRHLVNENRRRVDRRLN